MPHRVQKTSWADDVEDLGRHSTLFVSSQVHHFPDQSKGEDFIDENGIRTTVEYTVNEEGKKIKVCRGRSILVLWPFSYSEQITRRIKRTLQKSLVEHAVAERKSWVKFGLEKGNKPGPDRATTTVGETVFLKLTPGNKVLCDSHALYQFTDIFTSSHQNRNRRSSKH
jgi:translation initiation factor 3 subunit G